MILQNNSLFIIHRGFSNRCLKYIDLRHQAVTSNKQMMRL